MPAEMPGTDYWEEYVTKMTTQPNDNLLRVIEANNNLCPTVEPPQVPCPTHRHPDATVIFNGPLPCSDHVHNGKKIKGAGVLVGFAQWDETVNDPDQWACLYVEFKSAKRGRTQRISAKRKSKFGYSTQESLKCYQYPINYLGQDLTPLGCPAKYYRPPPQPRILMMHLYKHTRAAEQQATFEWERWVKQRTREHQKRKLAENNANWLHLNELRAAQLPPLSPL